MSRFVGGGRSRNVANKIRKEGVPSNAKLSQYWHILNSVRVRKLWDNAPKFAFIDIPKRCGHISDFCSQKYDHKSQSVLIRILYIIKRLLIGYLCVLIKSKSRFCLFVLKFYPTVADALAANWTSPTVQTKHNLGLQTC